MATELTSQSLFATEPRLIVHSCGQGPFRLASDCSSAVASVMVLQRHAYTCMLSSNTTP